jgi:hypothetical protein
MTKLTTRQADKLIEAAQNAISFTVDGRGDFPYDMLRYDLCWPASEAMARRLGPDDHPGERTVILRGLKPPTTARWASFGWTVREWSLT